MKHEGPDLETLTRRLAECPPEFLEEPRVGMNGKIHVAAVVHDMLRDLGYAPLGNDWLNDFMPGADPASALETSAAASSSNSLMDRLLSKISGPTGDGRIQPKDYEWLCCVLVATWLLRDDWFVQKKAYGEAAKGFLLVELRELSTTTSAQKLVNDPDRREELVRLCLKSLSLRPKGESLEQATDRLSTLNASERMKLLKAVREAEKRAKAIRDAMLKKAAEEAAAKYNRE